MDDIFKQLKKARGVRMTDAERTHIRNTLLKVSGGTASPYQRPMVQSTVSPFGFGFFAKVAAFVLVGFIAGGTTLSFASTKSLPGDQLYAIKTNVVEKINDTLAFGIEAKARAQAEHVATRVSEITTLKTTGRIDEPGRSEAALAAFDTSFASYTDAVTRLKTTGRVARSNEIALATLSTVKTIAPAPKPTPAAAPAVMTMMAKTATFSAGMPSAGASSVTEKANDSTLSTLDTRLIDAVNSLETFTGSLNNNVAPVGTDTPEQPAQNPEIKNPTSSAIPKPISNTPETPKETSVSSNTNAPVVETTTQTVTNPRLQPHN